MVGYVTGRKADVAVPRWARRRVRKIKSAGESQVLGCFGSLFRGMGNFWGVLRRGEPQCTYFGKESLLFMCRN